MADMDRTMGLADPMFIEPFVDVDEWRDEPVSHRYVHGGFHGTDCRFSMYFPDATRYQGRFFHPVSPVPGSEHGATEGAFTGYIEFAVASGGYLVESNLGRFRRALRGEDSTVAGYRASVAVATYSRVLAAEMYGEHRPYGYVFGGSGGAYRAIACIENGDDVWDGAVPYIHGTMREHAEHVLGAGARVPRAAPTSFPQIVDALEPGGSGDMYAGLTEEERDALAEATRMGFPPGAWFDAERVRLQYTTVWAGLFDHFVTWDPTYFDDFWTVPGLPRREPDAVAARRQGRAQDADREADPAARGTRARPADPDGAARAPHRRRAGRVRARGPARRRPHRRDVALHERAAPPTTTCGSRDAVATTSRPASARRSSSTCARSTSATRCSSTTRRTSRSRPTTATRCQPPTSTPSGTSSAPAGRPVYPQRPQLLGPRFVRNNGAGRMDGRFAGKMIVVQSLFDEIAYPQQVDWYRRRGRRRCSATASTTSTASGSPTTPCTRTPR